MRRCCPLLCQSSHPITGIVDIEKLDLSSDISLDGLGRILGSTLAGLSEAVQETLIVGSLAGATIVAPGCPAIEIRDPATLNQAFQGPGVRDALQSSFRILEVQQT